MSLKSVGPSPFAPGHEATVRIQGLLNDLVSAMNAGDGNAGRELLMEMIVQLGGKEDVGLQPGNAMLYATFLALRHLYTVESARSSALEPRPGDNSAYPGAPAASGD